MVKQRKEVPMRKLTIALAFAGSALAIPAAAEVVYQAAPANTAIVAAPAPSVVVAPSAQAYAYVAPPAARNVYSYSNPNYSYSKYTDASGCTVEAIRDYGSITTHRNCY
jgi:hypothetical protein